MKNSLTLQWRYNGRDGVSNHQPHDCLFNRLIRRTSKKTSKFHVTGFCAGNSPVTGEFPAQRASNDVTWKMLPFDDIIMIYDSYVTENIFSHVWCLSYPALLRMMLLSQFYQASSKAECNHIWLPWKPSCDFLLENSLYTCLAIMFKAFVGCTALTHNFEIWSSKYILSSIVTLKSWSLIFHNIFINYFQKHDDVIKWKHFPRYWPFVRGIHRSPVNYQHKSQWREALMFSLTCVWINGWVHNHEAGDLRRYRAHYDVTVMTVSNYNRTIIFFGSVLSLRPSWLQCQLCHWWKEMGFAKTKSSEPSEDEYSPHKGPVMRCLIFFLCWYPDQTGE